MEGQNIIKIKNIDSNIIHDKIINRPPSFLRIQNI